MRRRIVPDLVHDQILTILHPSQTALDAARLMAERNIGAVLIAEQGKLLGICTERDITQRVVAKGKDAGLITVAEIMTPDPATVEPGDTQARALDIMRRIGSRHLPVVAGNRIVGILSIRDLYAAVHDELAEDIKLRDELFMGSGYSMSH